MPKTAADKQKPRQRRERKECFGQMVQTDGSIEKYFEDRGPKAVLMGYIDDTTGIFFGRFYPSENTKAAMGSFKRYIEKYGIPQSLYFDRNSIYKTTRQPSVDEQLKEQKPLTQFGKVMKVLDVEKIFAHCPQGKGRIERAFKTLQDRLIKEMGQEGISSIEEANEFLENRYLSGYNDKFSVPPQKDKTFTKRFQKR